MLLAPFPGLHFAINSKTGSHCTKAYFYYYALLDVVLPEKFSERGKFSAAC
jgi:hypothetical protein